VPDLLNFQVNFTATPFMMTILFADGPSRYQTVGQEPGLVLKHFGLFGRLLVGRACGQDLHEVPHGGTCGTRKKGSLLAKR